MRWYVLNKGESEQWMNDAFVFLCVVCYFKMIFIYNKWTKLSCHISFFAMHNEFIKHRIKYRVCIFRSWRAFLFASTWIVVAVVLISCFVVPGGPRGWMVNFELVDNNNKYEKDALWQRKTQIHTKMGWLKALFNTSLANSWIGREKTKDGHHKMKLWNINVVSFQSTQLKNGKQPALRLAFFSSFRNFKSTCV